MKALGLIPGTTHKKKGSADCKGDHLLLDLQISMQMQLGVSQITQENFPVSTSRAHLGNTSSTQELGVYCSVLSVAWQGAASLFQVVSAFSVLPAVDDGPTLPAPQHSVSLQLSCGV